MITQDYQQLDQSAERVSSNIYCVRIRWYGGCRAMGLGGRWGRRRWWSGRLASFWLVVRCWIIRTDCWLVVETVSVAIRIDVIFIHNICLGSNLAYWSRNFEADIGGLLVCCAFVDAIVEIDAETWHTENSDNYGEASTSIHNETKVEFVQCMISLHEYHIPSQVCYTLAERRK